MKGDFTRSTFRPQNHYSSVRMQQGRLQLDADWNEQIDIQRHLLQMQARDMLGTSGVPMADLSTERSFQIDVIENGKDLAIAPGRMYIDGILCELEPGSFLSFDRKATSEPDRTEIEVSTLLVDGQNLAPQQWIEIFSADQTEVEPRYRVRIAGVDPTPRLSGFTITLDRSSIELKSGKLRRILTLNTQPDYPQPDAAIDAQKSWVALTQGKSYLVYMDVWQRHLTAIEAPNIRESALNLPDTTTRNKTVWQVKLLELEPDKDIKEQWNASLKVRNATLKARANPTFSNGGANSSLRRLENQLYRIEIHTPGKAGQATFKWSRDNGTIVSAIENLDDTTNIITIAQPSRDVSQLFAPNQWVEISDNVRDLNGLPGTLVRLTADTSGTKLVFQKAKDRDIVNLSQFPKAQKPKVRRWDHTTSTAEIPTVVHKWLPLDNEGIEVWFDDNSDYQTGDYWFIPARTVTNDIEWLQDDFRNPLPQAIAGTYHAYGCLAVLKYEQDQLTVVDDRNPFPALANCLPKSGGTITGSLTIQDSLTVKQRLTANQLTSETFTINSGKINSPINLFLQTSDQNQLSIIHETGNIGIGITDPKIKLHVAAPEGTSPTLRLSAGDRYLDIGTQTDNLTHFITNTKGYQFDEDIRLSTGSISSIPAQNLFLRTAQTNRITILSDTGNVGVGIDQPLAKLQVAASADQPQTLRLSNGDRYLAFGSQTLDRATFETNCQQYYFDRALTVAPGMINSPNDLHLQTAGNSQLTVVQSSGHIGIGTDAPTAKFHIATPESDTAAMRLGVGDRHLDIALQSDEQTHFQTNGKGYHFDQSITIASGVINSPVGLSFQTANTEQITILQAGNIGIGTNTPEAKLHIVGDIRVNGKVVNSDSQITSSKVHKENIVDLTSQEVATLLQGLNPVKFIHKVDPEQQPRAGFIAEEVPDLVASSDRQAVRLMELIAILTKSVKDHEQTIATLTEELADRQSQTTLLSDRIFALENQRRPPKTQRALLRNFTSFLSPLRNAFRQRR